MKATMVQCYTPSHTTRVMALWAWNVRSECIQTKRGIYGRAEWYIWSGRMTNVMMDRQLVPRTVGNVLIHPRENSHVFAMIWIRAVQRCY